MVTLYIMPNGSFPTNASGQPVAITQAEFEACCCDTDTDTDTDAGCFCDSTTFCSTLHIDYDSSRNRTPQDTDIRFTVDVDLTAPDSCVYTGSTLTYAIYQSGAWSEQSSATVTLTSSNTAVSFPDDRDPWCGFYFEVTGIDYLFPSQDTLDITNPEGTYADYDADPQANDAPGAGIVTCGAKCCGETDLPDVIALSRYLEEDVYDTTFTCFDGTPTTRTQEYAGTLTRLDSAQCTWGGDVSFSDTQGNINTTHYVEIICTGSQWQLYDRDYAGDVPGFSAQGSTTVGNLISVWDDDGPTCGLFGNSFGVGTVYTAIS
jgi:hypothetical protein